MTATAAEAFEAWCAFLAPTEGGLSLDPADSGNYTPAGILKGSKFGISSHSYPDVDIANLTLDAANQLRWRDFWLPVHGDTIHPSIAFVLAEAAYGSGPLTARRQMQSALGVKPDGIFGTLTTAALDRAASASGLGDLLTEFSARRLLFEASLGAKWLDFEGGWTRRLFRGLLVARALA